MEFFKFKCSNGSVICDKEDVPILSRFSWSISRGYATTSYSYSGKRQMISMHRLIMGLSDLHVDHVNGDTLDNRKCNLRLCTRSQNMANTKRKGISGYRGVTINNYNKLNPNWKIKYTARLRVNNKRIHLGAFDTAEEAARAYDVAAKEHFGVFARLNFVETPDRARALLEKEEDKE